MLEETRIENSPSTRERARVYVTGDCDGLPDLRDSLANHPEVELVGSAGQVGRAGCRPERDWPGPGRRKRLLEQPRVICA